MTRLRIKKKIKGNQEITVVSGFTFSYGLGLDLKFDLYIPDFINGLIYRLSNNLNSYDIFILNKNHLTKSNYLKFKIIFYLFKLFKSNLFLKKPHDIFFEKNGNFYIVEMGLGNGLGNGQVICFDKNNYLTENIGRYHNNKKGLIDPVMVTKDNDILFISEYGNSKIIKYDKNKISQLVYKDNHQENLDLKLDIPHAFKKGYDGNYYLADTWNHRIIKFSKNFHCLGWIGKQSDGQILSGWKIGLKTIKGNEDGAFNGPVDIAFNKKFIFLTDCFNNRVIKTDYSGKFQGLLNYDLNNPYGLEFKNDTFYIADKGNHQIIIIKDKNFTNE